MTLTPKEHSLLTDLKSQEELCIKKYGNYAERAHDTTLKNLFNTIKSTEQEHLSTISQILSGREVKTSAAPAAVNENVSFPQSKESSENKEQDAFLCKDALTMEKHVSSLYDTSVFEFNSPVLRDTLSHIQKEEQNHGMELYKYMSANSMYG
jgi:spore coat protein CotF